MTQEKFKEIDWDLIGWKRGCENIEFKRSKINQLFTFKPRKEYSMVSFTYDFTQESEDTTYFAYSFPYSFSKLNSLLGEFRANPFLRSFY
jgi:hypothetical protein